METVDQAIRSHIQRLPDEVLARLFIVGSWLPGRMSDESSNSAFNMHPLQLKPYAKLVSQVCSRWRSIVYWQSNRRELHHAAISLKFSDILTTTNRPAISSVLKTYLDVIKDSEDAELDVEWELLLFAMPDELVGVESDVVVRLFLHGMNLTAPHFNRVRSLKAEFSEPEIGDFCYFLLNSLGDVPALTHLHISGPTSKPRSDEEPGPVFIPTCIPFTDFSITGIFHPFTPYPAMSDLSLHVSFRHLEKSAFPPNLLHLSLYEYTTSSVSWNGLWAPILRCGSLRTLAIDPPDLMRLSARRSDHLAIDLPCLRELTFRNVTLGGMLVTLPLLVTPNLNHIYFDRLYDDSEKKGRIGTNLADSHSDSVRNFVEPKRLLMRLEGEHNNVYTTIASLLSCMMLDRLELLELEGNDFYDPSPDPYSTPRSMGRAVFELTRKNSRRHNRHDMPEVRVRELNGTLLYSSLKDADFIREYIMSET